ncbi:MAG: gamma-glutamyltransferase family protein, partial [Dehalococcoidia bacterium]
YLPLSKDHLSSYPTLREVLMPGGRLVGEGEVLFQRDLGRTFGRLAEVERAHSHEGREKAIRAARDYFYRGDIAQEMAEFCQSNGGLLTYEDLVEYSVKLEPPERGEYKGFTVYTCGPWCQGPSLIEVLNILEEYDVGGMGHNSADYVHVVAEAVKLAFADRHYYFGDPEFVPVPMAGLLSKDYAKERRNALDLKRAWPEIPEPGDPFRYQSGPRPDFELARRPEPKEGPEPLDTSYACVVDRWGNAFSATPSDGYSTPFVPGLGLSVSPRGSQSWLEPDHPSCVAPWKRPRLTPNPAMILKDGRPFMVFGTPGADVQVQSMAQLLLNIVEFGMDPQQAVEAPRFASYSYPASFWPHNYRPGLLCVEPGIGQEVSEGLTVRGHRVEGCEERDYLAGGLCVILVDQERGTLAGGADYRRECYAIGR